ncbi:MAG: hypothetical protein HYX92_04190 [Chloroflexi bacterium]|nr:hypothetical protein [Chloroflexota bacterium]
MAISGKYGKVNIPGIRDDEPVFILRAQDELAAPAMEMYQALAESHGAKLAASVREAVASFRQWNGARKLPD